MADDITAFDSDPALRWLFCFGHPDDEVAIGAWIRFLASQGNEVHLSWTHSNPVRVREAQAAAQLLCVPPENLHFHNAPDGLVVDHLAALLPKFRNLIDLTAPDRVVVTAFEQGHLDHDATHWLVQQAFDGPIFEFPMYHAYLRRFMILNRFADPTGQEIRINSAEERQFKAELIRQYPAQSIRKNVQWYEIYHRLTKFKSAELGHTERLRLARHSDFRVPNLPEPLRSRVVASPKWQAWLTALDSVQNGEGQHG